LGRPPKPGARYPSGKLKPAQEQRIAPALIHRIRDHAGTMGIDRRFGSEVGRLLMLEQLTGLEAGAAWRMAEVYGRYERFHGITRTTRSPSYESGMAGGGAEPHDGAEHEAAKDAYLLLRNHLRPFSHFHVQEMERLCVDDRYIGPAALADVKPILHRMAKQHFGTTRDARTEETKRPAPRAPEIKPRISPRPSAAIASPKAPKSNCRLTLFRKFLNSISRGANSPNIAPTSPQRNASRGNRLGIDLTTRASPI